MFAQIAAESTHRAEVPPLAYVSSMESTAAVDPHTTSAESVSQEVAAEPGGGDDVIFETDPRSRKARVKNSEALMALCQRHKKTLDRSNLRVCEGRKVVYLLAEGEISHPCCFFKESPTPSHRSKGSATPTWVPPKEVTWNSVMIPDGWKVGVVVDGDPWTAETCVIDGCIKYRFTFVDQQGREVEAKRSEWCETPGAAFKSLFCRVHPNKDVGRHNGKLYIGCHYDSVQDHLRSFFKKKKDAGAYDGDGKTQIKALLEQWIKNEPLDVITRKPLKRFSNIRGPILPPHFKRMRRLHGDWVNGPSGSNAAAGGGSGGASSGGGVDENDDMFADPNHLIDTLSYYSFQERSDIVNNNTNNNNSDDPDAIIRRSQEVSSSRSHDIFKSIEQLSKEDGILAATAAAAPVSAQEMPSESADLAFRFLLSAHPEDRFTAEEIYSLVRLQLATDNKLYAGGDTVKLASVRELVSRAVQIRGKDDVQQGQDEEEDEEEEDMCTMEEFFHVQAIYELGLIDAILSRAKDIDDEFHAGLERALGKVRTVYRDYVSSTSTNTTNMDMIATELENIRTVVKGLDLEYEVRWDVVKEDGDGLQNMALGTFVKLVKQVLGVPHSLGFKVPQFLALKNQQQHPQEICMGSKSIWDELRQLYADRLRDDARAGLGLLFSSGFKQVVAAALSKVALDAEDATSGSSREAAEVG